MPTNDYNSSALIYKALFDALNRTPTVALVPENEEYNRDELLHYIEEKFKTGVKGGITAENLRAILHTIVKSSIIKQDDERMGVLMCHSIYMSTGAADRWYYGSYSYGWSYVNWSQYITNATLTDTALPSISGIYSHMGVDVPFPLYNFTVYGSITKATGTGIVDLVVYYADNDDSANATLQNVVHLATVQVDCAVTNTSYPYSQGVTGTKIIPEGKKIFAFIRNTSYSSAEKIKVTLGYKYTSKVSSSDSFTLSR